MSKPKMKAIRMAAPEGETIPKDVDDIDRHKILFFGKYHPITKPWIRKEIRLYTRPVEGSVEVDYMGRDQAFALYALESDLK